MPPRKRPAPRQGYRVAKQCATKPSKSKEADPSRPVDDSGSKSQQNEPKSSIPAEAREHVEKLSKYPLEQVIHWLMLARFNHGSLETIPTSSPPGEEAPEEPAARPYACTFCNKSFRLKGVWKRHEDSFHELLRSWQCPSIGCNQTFTAENKFIQHHQNYHDCRNCSHAKQALRLLPRKAGWGCGFCADLLLTWDERIDHIAAHFEAGWAREDWSHSNVIKGLLSQPKIAPSWTYAIRTAQATGAITSPEDLCWDQESTRELQLQLEHSDAMLDLDSLVHHAISLSYHKDTFSSHSKLHSDADSLSLSKTSKLYSDKLAEMPPQHVIPPKAYMVRSYLNSASSSEMQVDQTPFVDYQMQDPMSTSTPTSIDPMERSISNPTSSTAAASMPTSVTASTSGWDASAAFLTGPSLTTNTITQTQPQSNQFSSLLDAHPSQHQQPPTLTVSDMDHHSPHLLHHPSPHFVGGGGSEYADSLGGGAAHILASSPWSAAVAAGQFQHFGG